MHCMPKDSGMNCLQWIFQSELQANIVHNPLEFAAFLNSFNCDECEAEAATVLIRMKNIFGTILVIGLYLCSVFICLYLYWIMNMWMLISTNFLNVRWLLPSSTLALKGMVLKNGVHFSIILCYFFFPVIDLKKYCYTYFIGQKYLFLFFNKIFGFRGSLLKVHVTKNLNTSLSFHLPSCIRVAQLHAWSYS